MTHGNGITQEQYFERLFKKFPENKDKFDYRFFNYVNSQTNALIKCNACDQLISMKPNNHMSGKGCAKCAFAKNIKTTEFFINKVENKFPNKFIWDKFNYTGMEKFKGSVGCNKCGEYFLISPKKILIGHGCNKCAIKKNSNLTRLTTKNFIKKAIIVHCRDYDYSKVNYINYFKKVLIGCNKCNEWFWQAPSNHLQGKGCERCKCSLGEKMIKMLLKTNLVEYIPQYRFNDCHGKRNPLPFDFSILNAFGKVHGLIEYQGEQHFRIVEHFGGKEKFEYRHKCDLIKKEYCKSNRIPLLVLRYDEDDLMEEKISNFLKTLPQT